MNKQEVLDAMAAAGLERPRVMLVNYGHCLNFELVAGPNDRALRQSRRIPVAGTRNCKAAKNDVANAIESLKG